MQIYRGEMLIKVPKTAVIAWHFNNNGILGYGDNRKVIVGKTLTVKGTPRLCNYGLHGSRKVRDALSYRPAQYAVSLVWIAGNIAEGNDKLTGQRRHCINMLSHEQTLRILREWAIWCAWQALALIENPDARSIVGLQAAEKYLRGEITIDEMHEARAAAGAAAAYAYAAGAYAAYAGAVAAYAGAVAAYAACTGAANAGAGAQKIVKERQNTELEHRFLEAMGLRIVEN